MAWHPFLLAAALLVAIHLVPVVDPARLCAALFVAGVVPVYLLSYASFRVPAAIVASWIAHTGLQLVAAAFYLRWMGHSISQPSSPGMIQ